MKRDIAELEYFKDIIKETSIMMWHHHMDMAVLL